MSDTIAMNPEIKAQWVAALRSGEYEQAKGVLSIQQPVIDPKWRHCCLGVLCDLAVKAGLPLTVTEDDSLTNAALERSYDGQTAALPHSVMEWAGLDDIFPVVFIEQGDAADLAALNDNGKTFPEIADLIEASL